MAPCSFMCVDACAVKCSLCRYAVLVFFFRFLATSFLLQVQYCFIFFFSFNGVTTGRISRYFILTSHSHLFALKKAADRHCQHPSVLLEIIRPTSNYIPTSSVVIAPWQIYAIYYQACSAAKGCLGEGARLRCEKTRARAYYAPFASKLLPDPALFSACSTWCFMARLSSSTWVVVCPQSSAVITVSLLLPGWVPAPICQTYNIMPSAAFSSP